MRSQTERMYFLAEKLFVVVAFLYFAGAVLPVLRNPGDVNLNAQASDLPYLILQILVYLSLLPFILRVRGKILDAMIKNPVLMAFLLFALLSCLWSAVPLYTLRRAIVFAATTLVGLYLGARFDVRQQLRLVNAALVTCVVLSVLYIVALPRYGMDIGINMDAWRGVFIQKNVFARYIVIAGFTLLCFRPQSNRELLMKYSCLALSVGLLIGSLSKGSYVVALVAALLVFLYRLLHIDWKRLIPAATVALTIVAAGAVYIVSNADAVLKALGKNASLTGRIPLWETLLAASVHDRWIGYGFAGFWSTHNYLIWSIIGWRPLKAHNGFIDMLLELGAVGLTIFALNTAIAFWRGMKLVGREKTMESQWPLLMLSLICLYNMFETDLMVQNGCLWVLYVAITVSTQRAWSLGMAASLVQVPKRARFVAAEYEPCPQ